MSQPKANISRERLRQLRRNAQGKCFRSGCDKKWTTAGLCKDHYAADKKRLKKAYDAKKLKTA